MEREIPAWEKELEQRRAAARRRAVKIAARIIANLLANGHLENDDLGLTYTELAEIFGLLARTEGRPV